MSGDRSNSRSNGDSAGRDGIRGLDDRSPYAIAQDGLSELVGASVHAQRVEAMNAAIRVDVLFLTVSYAVRSAEAFVAASLLPQRRREMAHRSVTAELATALHVPERTMQRQLDEATALSTRLPVTLATLRAGAITMQHARVIVEQTTDLGDDDREACAKLDELLAELSRSNTAATVRRKARQLREDVVSETLAERHRAARTRRRVEFEPAADGMAWLHAFLSADDAALIFDRVDGVVRADREASVAGATDARRTGIDRLRDDALAADQVRADAARDLLLYGTLASGSALAEAVSRARPSVHVTVPVLTLMGESEAPGLLQGYGPIAADTARRLAARTPSFTRILTHPVTGAVLDVDRTNYRPPADLAKWLEVRDGTCRFPGCNRAARRSDIDHTIDWHDNGRTTFDNLAHLCPAHHHLKHETSWSVRQRGGGTLEWRSPAGITHTTHPANPIPTRPPRGGPPIGVSSGEPTANGSRQHAAPTRICRSDAPPPF